MSWLYVYCCFSLVLINFLAFASDVDFRAFDDTILFKVNWPDKAGNDLLDVQSNAEPYIITSPNNEKYQCFVPELAQQELITQETEYNGPNPIELLSVLFEQEACSYRIETYWTYELCHGRYIQQYHEDRDGKKVKVQRYELGKYDAPQIKKLSVEYDENAKKTTGKAEIPVKKIDGISMPYVEMEMTDGTICDLNGKPRITKVLYVCLQNGKQEIYSIKETATCEYETVVLTQILCNHPDYKPQDTGENVINCRPLDNTPKKPISLIELELESLKYRLHKATDQKPQKVNVIFHIDEDGQDGQPQVRVEVHPVDSDGKQYNIEDSLNSLNEPRNTLDKTSSVEHFLSGRNCLNGGNGWWKYEFCYGRSVTQYHIESGGSKKVVSLGIFDHEKHMEWIDANPHKKPNPIGQRKQISHFYSNGEICDKTGKPRNTEVKLKCVTNTIGSPSSVSLYLIEPKMCQYILGVESPLICDILEHADDTYGIISDKILVNFDELKTNINVGEEDERIANEDE